MGFIKPLLLKRIVTEKTYVKVTKILSIIFIIAALFVFVFGFIRMKNMNVLSPEGMGAYISFILLWTGVLSIVGVVFEFISEFIKIESEVKDLKDKIKELKGNAGDSIV